MYKLKEQYKGITVNKSGRMVILDNVRSNEVELLGVEHFFEKKKEKKSKPTDKLKKTLLTKDK